MYLTPLQSWILVLLVVGPVVVFLVRLCLPRGDGEKVVDVPTITASIPRLETAPIQIVHGSTRLYDHRVDGI